MTNRAVTVAGAAQIVQGGRKATQSGTGGQIGMALQAQEAHFSPHQHARVRRPMRLVTNPTALQPQRGMFKRKGTSLVPMAAKAPGFVARHSAKRTGPPAAMRVVAVCTTHRPLRQTMGVGSLELGPLRRVATRADAVHHLRGLQHKLLGLSVHSMAGGAGHLTAGVPASRAIGL